MHLVVFNAQEVYSALRAANNKVYAVVRVAVLMVYEGLKARDIASEISGRQNTRPDGWFIPVASDLSLRLIIFRRDPCDLIRPEQFKNCVPVSVATYTNE